MKEKPNKDDQPKNLGGRPIGSDKWTEEKALELGEELLAWLNADPMNIWFQRFLYEEKKLYEDIISYLSKKHMSFFRIIKKAKQIQEFKIADLAMKNKLNPAMTIFVLKNHFNYSNKDPEDRVKEDSTDIKSIEIKINRNKNEFDDGSDGDI
jgi:hypothetical protein